MGPRAVLIRTAPGRTWPRLEGLIRCRLVGFRSQLTLMKSDPASKVSKEVMVTPFSARKTGSISTISFPKMRNPNPHARRTTALPTFPRPITPRLHSLRERPGSFCQRPDFTSALIQGRRRAKASMYPSTESATGRLKAFRVRVSLIPRRSQAEASIESIPVPHLEMTFRRGAQASKTRAV